MMKLRRRELMANQVVLPTGYEQLKYVYCSQRKSLYKAGIATGVLANDVLSVRTVFAWINPPIDRTPLMYTGATLDGQTLSTPYWYVCYGTNGSYDPANTSGVTLKNVSHSSDDEKGTVFFGFKSGSRAGCFKFGSWKDKTWSFDWKLYELVLYDADGNELFNAIPCLNSDKTPGVYDTVSKTFKQNINGVFGYETLDGTVVEPQ